MSPQVFLGILTRVVYQGIVIVGPYFRGGFSISAFVVMAMWGFRFAIVTCVRYICLVTVTLWCYRYCVITYVR